MVHYNDPNDSDRVLVVILNRPRDLAIAREEGWYRVPLKHLPRQFAADYLAFYQTAACGAERWAIRYFAPVLRYRIAERRELLPDEPEHPRAAELYYQIGIGPLAELPLPLPARKLRRVTFISTSFGQLRRAADVRDLYRPTDGDGGDDTIWGAGMAGQRLV